MDWETLIKIGAEYIQKNDDDATTGLDLGDIANALKFVLGSNDGNGIDLMGLIKQIQDSNLFDVVGSWIGSGENAPIEPDKITELVSEDKIKSFAEQLGISEESAKKALADAIPAVVDKATTEEPSIAEQLWEQIGGLNGAINILRGFMR